MECEEIPLDFDAARMLAMYADGKSVNDIAAALCVSPNKVREKINEHPHEKEAAKRSRCDLRNAKYRRVGALAVDIQSQTLERFQSLLDSESTEMQALAELEDEFCASGYPAVLAAVAAAAKSYKVALPECERINAAERALQELELQRAKIRQIADIRAKLKDISAIGETAERRADLQDGLPTERMDNLRPNIVVFNTRAKKENPGESEGVS